MSKSIFVCSNCQKAFYGNSGERLHCPDCDRLLKETDCNYASWKNYSNGEKRELINIYCYRNNTISKSEALSKMLITSGFNFDGYTVTKYSGYISGDDAVEVDRGFAYFGRNTKDGLMRSLVEIRRNALQELKEAAYDLGCNAIIGVDFDYITLDPQTADITGRTVYQPYIFGVTANGNAVVIEKNGEDVIAEEATDFQVKEDIWVCRCGMENPIEQSVCLNCGRSLPGFMTDANGLMSGDEIINLIEGEERSMSILEIIKGLDESTLAVSKSDLLEIANRFAYTERMYGKNGERCLKTIKEYLAPKE